MVQLYDSLLKGWRKNVLRMLCAMMIFNDDLVSMQEPFWMDPEALDPPVKSHAILPKKTKPEKQRIAPRPRIWEKQTKASATCSPLAINRVKNRLGGPPPNLTRPPVNSPTKPYTPHPPCERSNSRMNTPRPAPEKSRKSNCHSPPIQEPPISRLNPNPSLPQQLGKRRLSSSNVEKTQTATMIPTKIGPWSGWPERTSLQDQPDDNRSNVSGNVREDPELSDVDGVIAEAPTCIDPPKEQLMMHEPRDLHPDVVVDDDLEDFTNNYPAPTFSKCCSGSERRRARSASMCRQGGYPRDHIWLRDSSSILRPPLMIPRHDILSPGRKSMDMCNRQIVNKDVMHRPVIRTSGTVSPKLSPKLSPRHHAIRSQHQFGKGNSKSQEMEIEEWSFFVTKMTDTLLQLRGSQHSFHLEHLQRHSLSILACFNNVICKNHQSTPHCCLCIFGQKSPSSIYQGSTQGVCPQWYHSYVNRIPG